MRFPALLVTALTLGGCTFYISGGTGDAGGSGSGSDDAFLGPDTVATDAGSDGALPPLGDAASDTSFPPGDSGFPLDSGFPFDGGFPGDAGTPGSGTLLETLVVPCSGQVVVSQQIYSSSRTYRVRASGQCKVDEAFGNDILADAEYQGTIVRRDKDMGVDTGVALYDITLGSTKQPRWGNYTSTHVYEITGPGFDVPVTARYHDKANNAYGNNSGSIKLEIFVP